MNLQQMRCVLEVSRVGSVTRAAQNLYISQPNLSRTIKELEKELGVPLFRRGAQGMEPTVQAAQFLRYAQSIIQQMDELESIYQHQEEGLRLSIVGPHSGYITRGLAAFLNRQNQHTALEVQYHEMEASDAMDAVSRGQVQLAILRYQRIYDEHFKELFAKAGLASRTLMQFRPCVLMASPHPLEQYKSLRYQQLCSYTHVLRGETQVPGETARSALAPQQGGGRIHVYDRASMYEVLRGVRGSYAWSNPLPEAECKRHGLIQRSCPDAGMNRDVVLWQAKHGLGLAARDCLVALQEAARRQGMVTGFYQSPTVPESTGAEPASEVEAMEEAPADSPVVPSTI